MAGTPSARERERREKQAREARKRQQTGRVIFGETPEVDLPHYGRTRLRFRNSDLALVERMLTPLLDELPADLRKVENDDGEIVDVANVWDAIEILGTRWPMDTIRILLHASTRHAGIDADGLDEHVPPSLYRDPNLERALGVALAVAFGAVGEEDDPTAGPTEAGD